MKLKRASTVNREILQSFLLVRYSFVTFHTLVICGNDRMETMHERERGREKRTGTMVMMKVRIDVL